MQRDYKVYLSHILDSIERIEDYTKNLSLKSFKSDRFTQDAVIRNLIVIGEAAHNLPDSERPAGEGVDWNRIVGLRNIVVHQYFRIDLEIIWDGITKDLPALKRSVSKSLGK